MCISGATGQHAEPLQARAAGARLATRAASAPFAESPSAILDITDLVREGRKCCANMLDCSSDCQYVATLVQEARLFIAGLQKLFGVDEVGVKSQATAEHYLREGVLPLEESLGDVPASRGSGSLRVKRISQEDFEYTTMGELRKPHHLPLLDVLTTLPGLFDETGLYSLKTVRDSTYSDGKSGCT